MKLRSKFTKKSTNSDPPRAEQPSKPRFANDEGVSAAARNLALAHHLDRLIEQGLVADYTQAARLLGVSQPRLTHLMSLLLLAPTIQEAILLGTLAPGDKQLRSLARIAEWPEQMQALSQA